MSTSIKRPVRLSMVGIFSILGVIILLSGVGVFGWKSLTTGSKTVEASSASSSKKVEVITTKADLEAAEKALDELNFEDDSALQAETQANL